MSFILPSNNTVTAIPLLFFLPFSLSLMALLLPVAWLPSPGDGCRTYPEGISLCQWPSATQRVVPAQSSKCRCCRNKLEGWEEDLNWFPGAVPVSALHWEGNFLYFWMTVPCHLPKHLHCSGVPVFWQQLFHAVPKDVPLAAAPLQSVQIPIKPLPWHPAVRVLSTWSHSPWL